MEAARLRRRIRIVLALFIAGTLLSALSALPLAWELGRLQQSVGPGTIAGEQFPELARWVDLLQRGVADMGEKYPFIFYGTDWLAFGIALVALAFLGPLRDPVRNAWVLQWGMLACLLVFPVALIAGPLRGIPWFHRVLDCSFAVFGFIPLWLCWIWTKRLAALQRPGAAPAPPGSPPPAG